MNLEEIIAYESESHDEDDDKTVSQEEERSDIDVTDMVSYESDDDRAQNLQSPQLQQPVSDKLSELAREILKGKTAVYQKISDDYLSQKFSF